MTADKAFSMIPQFLFYFVAFLAMEGERLAPVDPNTR